MKKRIKTINLTGYVVEINLKNVVITDKAGNCSVILNDLNKGGMYIKYILGINEKELIEFLEIYCTRIFTHIALMNQPMYMEEFKEFLLKYTDKGLNSPLAPDNPNDLDELKRLTGIKKILSFFK